MNRESYELYQYIDIKNIYTYSNSSVLKNKFDERESDRLSELEYRIVASQTLKLFITPILVRSVDDILAIHKFLFSDLYTWAGNYREVNISKDGNAFMSIQSFNKSVSYLNQLIREFHLQEDRKAIVKKLANILDNLNYFHPFREGNGRTQREVIRVLALMKGYECEIAIDSSDEIYHLYMDGTVYGDLSKLECLIDKLLVADGERE